MKRYLAPFVLLVAAVCSAQDKGIEFEHGSFKQALAKAKRENKLVMLDAYASWCGPCKWMAKTIFPKPEAGEFFNKNFVSIKIDMEKGEGPALAKKYGVIAYPTFIYTDAAGNIVHRTCGGLEVEEFIETGKTAMNSEKRLIALEKKFKEQPTSATAAYDYFLAADNGCMKVEDDVKKFLEAQKQEEYLKEDNIDIIMRFVTDYNHPSFKTLLTNMDKAAEIKGKEAVTRKIMNVYQNAISLAARKQNKKELEAIKNSYSEAAAEIKEQLNGFSVLQWADASGDTTAYINAAIAYTDKYRMHDANALNSVAWEFYEITGKKENLEKAVDWVKKSLEITEGPYNMDTYASLLYKLGRYDEAKKAAERAIELGKNEGADMKNTEELLNKINSQQK